MDNSEKILEAVKVTLEKYKKNKTLVSPEDLAGKYKAPFQKLKAQLAKELSEYLKAYCLNGVLIRNDDGADTIEAMNRSFRESGAGKEVCLAAFRDFDLAAVKRIAEEQRQRILEIYEPYFHRHTCIYTTFESWDLKNPVAPRIYNDLVDKFWDKDSWDWKADDEASRPLVLIYLKGDKARKETK